MENHVVKTMDIEIVGGAEMKFSSILPFAYLSWWNKTDEAKKESFKTLIISV